MAARKSQQETSQPEEAGDEIKVKKSCFFKEQLYVSARYADKKRPGGGTS